VPETLAAFDWPSYSTSVLPGSVDTRHVDKLLDDMQSIPVVHLVAEATRPRRNGPKSAPCFNAAGLRDHEMGWFAGYSVVPPAGVEPAFSCVKGRRPNR